MEVTNREGMTKGEWMRAAYAWGAPAYPPGHKRAGGTIPTRVLVKAWKAGEDPTEYAVHTRRNAAGSLP